MGKIITIKVNKGGIGKSFITLQIGSLLALKGYRTLILTSDSQNNILEYSFPEEKIIGFDKGLKEFVKGKEGELIKLRESLYFIPLESSTFGNHFFSELPVFLEKMRMEYDYIIIDSIPTMKLDSVFVECSDKIIIPAYCDRVTVEGAVNVIEEAGADKVLAIAVNRYLNIKTQSKYLEMIKRAVEGTNIIMPEPIQELSAIAELLDKGKTLWESRSKNLERARMSIETIVEAIEGKEKEDFSELDFDF